MLPSVPIASQGRLKYIRLKCHTLLFLKKNFHVCGHSAKDVKGVYMKMYCAQGWDVCVCVCVVCVCVCVAM